MHFKVANAALPRLSEPAPTKSASEHKPNAEFCGIAVHSERTLPRARESGRENRSAQNTSVVFRVCGRSREGLLHTRLGHDSDARGKRTDDELTQLLIRTTLTGFLQKARITR